MQQLQLTSYADVGEVRTVTGAAACNQLLADGWVLLGVYPGSATLSDIAPCAVTCIFLSPPAEATPGKRGANEIMRSNTPHITRLKASP
jgi:hypothetical protein